MIWYLHSIVFDSLIKFHISEVCVTRCRFRVDYVCATLKRQPHLLLYNSLQHNLQLDHLYTTLNRYFNIMFLYDKNI